MQLVKKTFSLCAIIAITLVSLPATAALRPQKSLDGSPSSETAKPDKTQRPQKSLDGSPSSETAKPDKTQRPQKSLDGSPPEATAKPDNKKTEKRSSKELDSVDTSKSTNTPPPVNNSGTSSKKLDEVDPAKVKQPRSDSPRIDPPKNSTPRNETGKGNNRERVNPPNRNNDKPEKLDKPEQPDSSATTKPELEVITEAAPDYPEMVAIQAGSFKMGSDSSQSNESPSHDVKLSGFEISKFEITNQQFFTFVQATSYKTTAEKDENSKYNWKNYAVTGRERYPVVMVSWEDATKYCQWLSETNKATYRLPTEAEWEYAARAGSKDNAFPWGDKLEVTKANYAADDSRKSYSEPVLNFLRSVGSYEPNAFGLHDVVGNVWEWCHDWYQDGYYQQSPPEDPLGPTEGKVRTIRGGGWGHAANYCSVSFRKPMHPSYRSSSLGFRVVKVTKK